MEKKIPMGIVVFVIVATTWSVWFLTKPFKIGVILTTGTTLGSEENMAVRFYRARRPRIGWRPVQYLIHNPKPDEKEIVDAYRTLERAGVSIILGGAVNRAGMIIAKEAKRSGVPTLGITASTHALNDQKDNFYRLAASTRGVSSNLAAHLMRKNISRVAILTSVENKARADPLAEAFREAFARESIKIPFGSPETAFKTMWDWQPEVVFSILPETDLIQVIREVKAKKPGPMIISAEWGFDNVVSMFSGPLLNGVRSCTRIGYISPEYREILHEFEKTHDLRATFASVNAFSCLSVVYRALEEAGGDRDRLRAWLDQPRIHDVGHGKIFLNEFGDSIMQHHYIQEISDDRLILIEKVKVREFPWENEFDS